MSESKGPVNNQEFLGEKSAELLDNILNTSAVGIAYAKDRIILWANQAMLKLFGFTKKAQVLGKNTRMLYASEQEYQRVGQIAYQRQQADQIIELDAQFKRHDDSLFDAHVKINPLEPSAHIEGIIVSIMDITERKRTEAALRVSEKEMRALFAAMTDIVLVLDQKGQYLGIAPTNPDLLYRPADELLGKTLHQVFSREQADLFLAHIHRALEEQQPVHIEYSLIIAEKKKWFVAVLSPMSQETVVAVIRDITARKQAEQALQESEEKYRVLFESFPLGITITDQEGNVLEVNQESERLLRLPSADHKQRTIDGAQWQIIRPDGSPMPTKEYASVRALQDNRLIENVEMGIVQEQGAITWLNVTAAPIPLEGYGVAVAYGDITEQVRAQRALEQERDLSRTLINAAALVSSTLDPEQVLDRLLDQASRVIPNDAANIMLIEKSRKARIVRWRGYEQFGIEEFVSTALFAFDELPNLRQMFQTGRQIVIPDTATYSGWVNLPETTWLRSYAGAPIRVRDMVIGFLSLDSVTPNTFSALHADILRAFADHAAVALENARLYREVQKELAERKRLETQLVQAQKMEAIGRLAGGIAHDFNNHLTAIGGYADLLLLSLDQKDPLREDVIEISKAAERSAALTRQLLAFSRKQIIHPQIIDLNDLIANMDQMLRRLIGEDIALVTTLEPDPHQVRVDLSQMEQVMMNLVVNARDAMPYGGRLQIETQNVQLTEGYDHQGAHIEPGDYVLLLVRDNGQGMDDEMLSHIFEPFFTTKAKGTGLGLATVYGIIKQNQGYIFVRSRPGKGTAFEIYLPSAHGPSEPIARQSPAVTIRQGHETILLVEDDVGVRSLAKQILEQSDYTVLTAGNAEQALLIAQAQPPPIHLLLTDVVMPGSLSGTALAERLQNIHPETKVMYMSGYTDEAIVQHGVLEPGIHFLHKPFTTAALTAQVRKVLDR